MKNNYKDIITISNSFSENEEEKFDFRIETQDSFMKWTELDTAILNIVWEEEGFALVYQKITEPSLDICVCIGSETKGIGR